MSYPKIQSVQVIDDYTLLIEFDNLKNVVSVARMKRSGIRAAQTATATLETLPPQNYASPKVMIMLSLLGGLMGSAITEVTKEILKEKIKRLIAKWLDKQPATQSNPPLPPSIEIVERKLVFCQM